jgi:transcriptional regulator with XRE-family HTH domain
MTARRMTQEDIAKAARVSQPTVSRVLRREPQRSGAAYLRLCSYIHQQVRLGHAAGPGVAFEALRVVWDGSERHAAALTELINASQHLWPGMATTEGESTRVRTDSVKG